MTSNDEQLPERLGKYHVRGLLGSGGMGSVYLAEDPDIGRLVAIKIVNVGADPESRERFKREAQTLGRLNHPNIVTLLEYGDQGGQQFLALEYLPGDDLSAWIKAPRSLHAILTIAIDIGRALAAAHAQGVLHRDIKPANVRVLPDGHAKLMDFGIARGRDATLTSAGLVVGTPEYLAPEVVFGEPASAQSDLHAFGTLLHNLCTGESVFAGDTYATTVARVLHRQPPPLGQMLIGVPPALSGLVDELVQKKAEDRPASAQAVVARLESIRSSAADLQLRRRANALGQTTQVPQWAPPPPQSRPWRRAGLITAVITVTAVVAASWWISQRGTTDDRLATTPDRPVATTVPSPAVPETASIDAASASPTNATPPASTPPASVTPPDSAVDVAARAAAANERTPNAADPAQTPHGVGPATLTKPHADTRRDGATVESRNASAAAPKDTSSAHAAAQVLPEPPKPVPTVASATPPTAPSLQAPADVIGEPANPPEAATRVIPTVLPPPEILSIAPQVLRRGQGATITVRGKHLATVKRVEIVLGTGHDVRFDIGRISNRSDDALKFSINVARSVPLGRYFLVLVGDDTRSTPMMVEVGL